jgi:hypothetical protein
MEQYPLRAEKLSVSLTPEAIAPIACYRANHAIKSGSQVIEHALRKLRARNWNRLTARWRSRKHPTGTRR